MSYAPIFQHSFPQTQGGVLVSGANFTIFEYGEIYSHTSAISGALSISSFVSAYVVRFNNMVRVVLSPWGGGTATASSVQTYGTALPARFRPLVSQTEICCIKRNMQRTGSASITPAGVITVFGDEVGANFNNGQTCQLMGTAIFEYSIT